MRRRLLEVMSMVCCVLLAVAALAGPGVASARVQHAAAASSPGGAQAVTGTVTAADGGAVSSVAVSSSVAATGAAGPSATTQQDGTYTVRGLLADTDYVLCFDAAVAPAGPPTGYAHTCSTSLGDTVFVLPGTTRTGADVELAVGGEIDGTVGDTAGHPLAGVAVTIGAGTGDTRPTGVSTGADGRYAVRGLAAGRYAVCFEPTAATGGSAPHGYLGGCAGGDYRTVPVDPGLVTSGIDASLTAHPYLTGRVTGAHGAPLAGVTVAIGDGTSTRTDTDGNYLLLWSGNGSDSLCFTPPRSVKFGQRCRSVDEGGVQSDPGVRSEEDESFARTPGSGVVTGTVTDTAGRPLRGIVVTSEYDGSQARAVTSSDGRYRLLGTNQIYNDTLCFTPGGSVRPTSPTGYLPTCTSGVDHLLHSVVTVDAQISLGARIAGTVTDRSGHPLPGLLVLIAAPAGDSFATTDAQGRYALGALAPGTYAVAFEADGAYGSNQSYSFYHGGTSPTGYLDQCWERRTPDRLCTTITAAAGESVTGIDGSLARAGGVRGTVTDTAGTPLRHARVDIVQPGYDDYEYTDGDGRYTAILLPVGTYRVCVTPFDTTPTIPTGYASRCYPDATGYDTATGIDVRSGHFVTGVDIRLPAAPVGVIAGRAVDAEGRPVAGVLVSADGQNGVTAADGSYRLVDIEPGTWDVCFDATQVTAPSPTGYLLSCTSASVSADARVTVHKRLQPAGVISGVVTDEAGTVLRDVDVTLSGAVPVADVRTDAAGRYRISGLPAGTYTAFFGPDVATGGGSGGFGLIGSWSGGGADASTAQQITVVAGRSTAEDARLMSAGAAAGVVTDDAGHPLGGISVRLHPDTGVDSYTTTAADGSWSSTDLVPTRYVVCFDANWPLPGAPYGITPFCLGGATAEDATGFSVLPGARTGGLDVALVRLGAVQAAVTDAAQHPLDGAFVQVFTGDGTFVGFGFTDSTGIAEIDSLPAGDYQLEVGGSSAGYPGGPGNGYSDAEVAAQVVPGARATATAVLDPRE